MSDESNGGKSTVTESDDSALEYVLGTLRDQERERFDARLKQDSELSDDVDFWQEQLMDFHHDTQSIEPNPATWKSIESKITGGSEKKIPWWQSLFSGGWQWAASSAMTLLVCLGLWFALSPSGDPSGYVAVMTNSEGKAILTALTPKGGDALWLQWEKPIELNSESDLQLWALSRSDAQTRSLAVFDTSGKNKLQLNQAQWRLIKDAEFLILTEEETGGSAIDEPSDLIVAKGICIRIRAGQKES